MKVHRNAALSWRGRRQLAQRVVDEGWTLKAAAEAAGVSVRCCCKWAGRYRLEGERGLLDRSSVHGASPIERRATASRRSSLCAPCG
jgi:transposase